jgi:hypothetical protein
MAAFISRHDGSLKSGGIQKMTLHRQSYPKISIWWEAQITSLFLGFTQENDRKQERYRKIWSLVQNERRQAPVIIHPRHLDYLSLELQAILANIAKQIDPWQVYFHELFTGQEPPRADLENSDNYTSAKKSYAK